MVSVWRDLKSEDRIGGRKRERFWSSCESDNDEKKIKISLNMSSTCSRIAELELSGSEEISLTASTLDSSRSSPEQARGELLHERSLDLLLNDDSDNFHAKCG